MPSTITHHRITKIFLGDEYKHIHEMIDSSVGVPRKELAPMVGNEIINPSSHRGDYIHNLNWWIWLYLLGKISYNELLAVYLHIMSDKIDTKNHHALDNALNPTWRIARMIAQMKEKFKI